MIVLNKEGKEVTTEEIWVDPRPFSVAALNYFWECPFCGRIFKSSYPQGLAWKRTNHLLTHDVGWKNQISFKGLKAGSSMQVVIDYRRDVYSV